MPDAALAPGEDQKLQAPTERDVRAVLVQRNPDAPAADVRAMAKILVELSDILAALPQEKRRVLARAKDRFRDIVIDIAEPRAQRARRRTRDNANRVEKSRGAGLGERISVEEGRERLDRYAVAMPLEQWAGPVAGAGDIEAQLGIPRSTLSAWQKRGAVVGLLRGERKFAYPLEQFIDARPLEGISEIVRVAPDARAAWLWLRQPHGALNARAPLEMLKSGRDRELVVKVAERDFV